MTQDVFELGNKTAKCRIEMLVIIKTACVKWLFVVQPRLSVFH